MIPRRSRAGSPWRAHVGPRPHTLFVPELALDSRSTAKHVAASLRSMCEAGGRPVGTIIVCADITDAVIARDLAVDDLALIWSAPLAEDADYFNERWRTYVAGASWEQAIEPSDLARCTLALGEASRERVSAEVEARVRRADGMYRWHRLWFVVSGTGVRWFGIAIDAHETHDAETERTELVTSLRTARADTIERIV